MSTRIGIVLGVLGVAAVAWTGVQAWQAKGELEEIVGLADDLTAAVTARDFVAADAVVSRVRVHADRAEAWTSGPLWAAAASVPVIGPNLEAVRTASTHVSDIADDALMPLVGLAGSVGGSAHAGTLTDRIAEAREPLARAAETLTDASVAVGVVDTDALLPPLRDAVIELRTALDGGAPTLEGVARVGAVLPGLLGADGPREILVMLQNTAELRTGGGITGTFVQLHAVHGEISLVRQADSGLFPVRDAEIAPVPPSTTALYGDAAGRFVQNATMTPDFAASAALASAWWSAQYGVVPDAVVAIDPVVLKALLGMHGPVVLSDGSSLDEENLVQRLLIDPYLHLSPDAQTAYLQDVTSVTMTALLTAIDPLRWTEALLPAVAEGRVSVWSAHPLEQAALVSSPVGGPRARLDAAGDAGYAVYFNDATGGKMDSYLDVSIDATVHAACAGGLDTAEVRVTLTNSALERGIPELPASMTGAGLFGTAVGDIGTNVSVAGPPGAGAGGVHDVATGQPLLSSDVQDEGRPFSAVRVNLSPGESETAVFRFVLPTADAPHPVVLHTPMIDAVPVRTGVAEGCEKR